MTGDVLRELDAPAGSNWSVNGAGTSWKYRDRSVTSGILNATVKATKMPGSFRVQLKARGLALDAVPAGLPITASIAFGVPTSAPGQCGATAFPACRTTSKGATVRHRRPHAVAGVAYTLKRKCSTSPSATT